MKEVGASPDGGTVPVGTPVTEAGKLTLTRLPVPSLVYPFLAAYWQIGQVEPAEQLKALPAVNI
jgi:hypothetical protein